MKKYWFELSANEALQRMSELRNRLDYIYNQINDGRGYGQPYISEVSSLMIELNQLNRKFIAKSLREGGDADSDTIEKRLDVGYHINPKRDSRSHGGGSSRRGPHRMSNPRVNSKL